MSGSNVTFDIKSHLADLINVNEGLLLNSNDVTFSEPELIDSAVTNFIDPSMRNSRLTVSQEATGENPGVSVTVSYNRLNLTKLFNLISPTFDTSDATDLAGYLPAINARTGASLTLDDIINVPVDGSVASTVSLAASPNSYYVYSQVQLQIGDTTTPTDEAVDLWYFVAARPSSDNVTVQPLFLDDMPDGETNSVLTHTLKSFTISDPDQPAATTFEMDLFNMSPLSGEDVFIDGWDDLTFVAAELHTARGGEPSFASNYGTWAFRRVFLDDTSSSLGSLSLGVESSNSKLVLIPDIAPSFNIQSEPYVLAIRVEFVWQGKPVWLHAVCVQFSGDSSLPPSTTS